MSFLIILFWLLWILTFVFGASGVYVVGPDGKRNWGLGGFSLVVWILLGILGFKLFDSPLK